MPINSVEMNISENQRNDFFSHVLRIIHPKNLVSRSKVKGVFTQYVHTGRQTRKLIQRTSFQGFMKFSFNLSSRIGPIDRVNVLYVIGWFFSPSRCHHVKSFLIFKIWYSLGHKIKKWPQFRDSIKKRKKNHLLNHKKLVLYVTGIWELFRKYIRLEGYSL